LAELPIRIDDRTAALAFGTTSALAARANLTVYGAGYLELALRLGLPLASLDTRLSQAATAGGVRLIVTLDRQPGSGWLERFFALTGAEVVSVTPQPAEIAIDAFRRFGKGRHRAALNIGDCFSYALATATNHPLLFKGNDFNHTDIRAVLPVPDVTPPGG
jgi:ribonuclease VapC